MCITQPFYIPYNVNHLDKSLPKARSLNVTSKPFTNTPSDYTVGDEEYRHTLQGEILGPLYFPAHLIGGLISMLRKPHPNLIKPVDPWHSNNPMETGPMQGRTF